MFPGLVSLGWLATAGIASSILIIIVASAARYSLPVPVMPAPSGPLPVELPFHLPNELVTLGLWLAALLGGGGVIAGLVAVGRGARYPAWLLVTAAAVVVAVLVILPPAGSTDTVSYATYGRIAVLGHNPYVMTPAELNQIGDPIGSLSHLTWHKYPSLYGPLATGEQWAAAKLGGTSATGIILWLKLWNGIAFLGVAIGLDRLLRSDPARRARAHLLWSVNPLLIWALLAGGHLDVLAAAASLLGLILLRTDDARGRVARALVAGLLVGIAADFMLTYLLFGLALAWALRRSWAALAAAAAGVCVAAVPAYVWVGAPIFRTLARRQGKVGADTFYQLISVTFRHQLPPATSALVGIAFLVLAALMLWRLPDAVPGLPAIQPALAFTVAWLFLWYYQLPWYNTMAIGVLAVYSASRLDWAVVGQLTAATVAIMPGTVQAIHPHWLARLSFLLSFRLMPLVLFGCLAYLVWLCATRAWNLGPRAVRAEAEAPVLTTEPRQNALRLRPRLAPRPAQAEGAIRVLCCQSSAIGRWWLKAAIGHRSATGTGRHSELRNEHCHGHRLVAPPRTPGRAGGAQTDQGSLLRCRDRDRRLDPDHARGIGGQVQPGDSPASLAVGSAAARAGRPAPRDRDVHRAVDRGRAGRRRGDGRPGRRGPRRTVPGPPADHGRTDRDRPVRRAPAIRVNGRAQLCHLRADRGRRPQPVRDDAQHAEADGRPHRRAGAADLETARVGLRPAGHHRGDGRR